MRALILLGIALALPARADDEHRPLPPIPVEAPWMTGTRLLQKLSRPAETAVTEDYIMGVYDATEHRDWCHAAPDGRALPKPRSGDMLAQARDGLRTMSADRLKGSAAVLLVEIWQDKWPCPSNGCCHD